VEEVPTTNLFRSLSTGPDDIHPDVNRDLFIPDASTSLLLQNCFPDFFTEEGGSRSVRRSEASESFLRRYRQMYELFEDGRGYVTRDSFLYGIKNATEHYIGKNHVCMQAAR